VEEFELRGDFENTLRLLHLLGQRNLASEHFQLVFCNFLKNQIPELSFSQVGAAFKLARVHCRSEKVQEFDFVSLIADKVKR